MWRRILKFFWKPSFTWGKIYTSRACWHLWRVISLAGRSRSLSADLLLLPHSRSGSVPRIGSSARRRLPLGGAATEGQSQAWRRRRRLPHLLSPVASRPRLRPPRTGRRLCVRTSLSPPASAVPMGARPAAQGGRALAPPVHQLHDAKTMHRMGLNMISGD